MPNTTTEPVGFKMLAAHYREQADVCLSMAEQALRPYDEEWLRLAAKWTRLARQAELKWGFRRAANPDRTLASDPQPAAIG
jgi:hypothetical protein